ncbi:hypothetical protein V8D89_011474 [Ganoderma adspersum]
MHAPRASHCLLFHVSSNGRSPVLLSFAICFALAAGLAVACWLPSSQDDFRVLLYDALLLLTCGTLRDRLPVGGFGRSEARRGLRVVSSLTCTLSVSGLVATGTSFTYHWRCSLFASAMLC